MLLHDCCTLVYVYMHEYSRQWNVLEYVSYFPKVSCIYSPKDKNGSKLKE